MINSNISHIRGVTTHRNNDLIKAFGVKVREIRKSKNLSMEDLAGMADIEYKQLSRIENGEVNTTISSAYNLSKALDVSIVELFTEEF